MVKAYICRGKAPTCYCLILTLRSLQIDNINLFLKGYSTYLTIEIYYSVLDYVTIVVLGDNHSPYNRFVESYLKSSKHSNYGNS